MGWMPISPWRPIAGSGQNLTVGASSTASDAFGDNAQAIQISVITANCYVAVGQAPVASSKDMLVKASDPPLIIRIAPGEKLAVIQATGAATLNVCELTH